MIPLVLWYLGAGMDSAVNDATDAYIAAADDSAELDKLAEKLCAAYRRRASRWN